MKSHIILIASALLALTSCGTTASFTQATGQQKYQDGIYYRPQSLSLEEQAAKLSETDELIAKTKSSAVFVKTVGKVDTLLIPENMSAQFKFNHKDSTTTVSLFNDYDSWYDWNWGISPFRYGRWYDPFWGPTWAMSPWAFNSWRYSSWYWGFHDPFWYDPFWYDPFWYDPFWGPSWGWGYSAFWGDPFWGPFSYMYPMGYGYGGYYRYFNRYDRGFGHTGRMVTRSSDSRVAAQPRRGVARVVRTGAASASAARTASKTSPAARISTASRATSSSVRSASAASVQRQPGVARSSGISSSSSTGVVRSSASSSVSRSGAAAGSTYRRSVPSTGSSSGSISRGSGSISRSSGGSSRPSTGGSVSSGSYSSSRSSSYSGSSSSSSVSRSSGSYSSGGGSVSRGSGGGGRR